MNTSPVISTPAVHPVVTAAAQAAQAEFDSEIEAVFVIGNDRAAHWYADQGLPGSVLATAAIRWRSHGIEDRAAARELLDEHLIAIHRDTAAAYANR